MENNFPINMDTAFDEVKNVLLEMEKADPEGFQDLVGRIDELSRLPKRSMKLLLDLMEAAPFEVIIPKNVQKKQPEIFATDREIVSKVIFLGDYGGISVGLEPNEFISDPRVVSITMVQMPPRSPLRRRVNEYRKNRIKKLQKHTY